MKFLLGVIVGAALAAGSAPASSPLHFWEIKRGTYVCRGSVHSVFCNEQKLHGYQIGLVPGIVNVAYNDKVVFWCKRGGHPKPKCAYVK